MTKTIKKSVAFLSAVAMVMAMLLYFPSGMFSNIDWGLKASAEGNTLTEPQKEGDVYQIRTAAELYWFAALVNGDKSVIGEVSQNTSANAVLTDNITVNSNVLNANGELNNANIGNFTNWTPIGNEGNQYTGTFNGQNHKISGLYFDNSSADYVGLFGYVGTNGSVSNVGVVDSYFKGADCVGGVCGSNEGGTIKNCYNTGAVSGSSTVGGVCGYNGASSNGTATIENCYNTGTVDGSVSGTGNDVGGVCGYNFIGTIQNCYSTGTVSGWSDIGGVSGYNGGGTIKNCYYLTGTATGGINGTDDVANNVLVKTTTQFTFGEVCYLLNNGTTDGTQVWYQTLDSDSYPLLDNSHGTVYACTPCTGVFSNTEGQHADHTYIVDTENGKQHKCEKCGETHNAVFTANDDTDTISVCCDHGTITLNAPTENLTYDGKEKAATVTGNIDGFDTPDIVYDGDSTTAPKNAGNYTASITYIIGETNYSVSVKYTIEKAEPDVTVDTNQNVVCGVGTFSEPTFNGVDGNALAGTIEYSIADKTKATADDVKNHLKTLPKGSKSSIGYTFTPTDTKNYKIATGTINYTMVDVAFMVGDEAATADNAVTVKNNPTYGDSWAEILTLKDGLKAVLLDETVTTGFSLAIDSVSDTSVKPNAGNYTYNVLFNGKIGGKDYTNHVVATGIVDVAKKELTVFAGTYKVSKVYDGKTDAGTGNDEPLSVSGIINNDDVTVNTGTIGEYSASDVGNDYKVAVAISLSGDKANNYNLTVPIIKVPAEITAKEITLTDDTAKVTGEYHYTGSAIVPTVEVKDGDTTLTLDTDYTVTCTDKAVGNATATIKPVKGGNYTFTDKDVTFTIQKATGSPSNAPTELTGCAGAKVSTASLPTGWVWDNEDTTFPETAGETGNATANYTADDAECYGVTTADVTLTATEHDYSDKQLCSAATCTSAAKYYKKCSVCGDVDKLSTFTYGSALGHNYTKQVISDSAKISDATCTSPAVYYYSCSRCNAISSTKTFTYGSALEHNDTDNDGYCNNGCGKLIHSVVKEVSATLDGDIGLNYYIALPESVTADTGAYVQFTVNGQNTKVFVKDVPAEENGTYKFTCWLTAKEMRDDVTFELYDGNGTLIDIYSNSGNKVEGASFDYSLETYLNTLSSDESGENVALKDLADATLVYGAYAQNAFNHNANSNLNGSELADVTVGTLETNKITKSSDIPEGLKLTEMTLILETETTLRLYFKSDNIGNYTFRLDGADVTLNTIAEESLYYVEIANISAKDLDTKHTLEINGECTLTFNALSYAYATVKADTNENICNVVKALYKYNDAANAYFGE